jgi:phosphoesterase RecJ-like protein
MLNFREVKALLDSPKKIVIIPHRKPDADALGSSLGLRSFLIKKGHDPVVISPTDYPEFLFWMEGNNSVVIGEKEKPEKIQAIINNADIVFCLDFNSLNRIDELGEMVRKGSAIKFMIDHHLDPECDADFSFFSTSAAATAELIYEFIVKLGDRELIDKQIADCLYAGIMTDTGQFKHNNTSQNVHYVTANLMELGADVSKVGSLIYDTRSFDQLKFLGFSLGERLKFLPEYNTAYIAISAFDLKRFNSKTGDTEGLVNYALSLNDAVLGALIYEHEDNVRLSFRSKGSFSVNDFARDHFNGGGHKNAAGGTSNFSFIETIENFENVLKEYKQELNHVASTFH